MSAYTVPASAKLIVVVGFVVMFVKNLMTPSEASLATAANLRCPYTETEPEAATEVTLVAVLSNVNVVVVGTAFT